MKEELARLRSAELGPAPVELDERRKDVVRNLDGALSENARAERGIAMAFANAARMMAPHFGLTNPFPDEQNYGGGLFGGETVRHEAHGNVDGLPQDSKLCIEIFSSAAAWLARAAGMPKAELVESFRAWAEEQGYEKDA